MSTTFDFFFNKLPIYREKGKGLSVFHASETTVQDFLAACERHKQPYQCVRLSQPLPEEVNIPSNKEITIIVDDLYEQPVYNLAEQLVEKILYPLYFNQQIVCYFSFASQSKYEIETIDSTIIHQDLSLAGSYLTTEQLNSLLKRVNFQFSSPEFLELSPEKTIYTPIEEMMKNALEEAGISYEAQVKFSPYTVDFLVSVRNTRLIIECDGAAFHERERDARRDQELSVHGYPILRFTGSAIYGDAKKCVEKIIQRGMAKQPPQYTIDENLDEDQLAAIKHFAGPARVLAPAGSGKTKTLVNRITFLINQGVDENKILALAFNTKAAQEMKIRLEQKMIRNVEVRTFHSLGYEIIRKSFNWKYDDKHKDLTRKLLEQSARKHYQIHHQRGQDSLETYLDALRKTKMELIPVEQITVTTGSSTKPVEMPFRPVFEDFLKAQMQHHHMDFDDMIYLAVRALLKDKSLRKIYQDTFEYILVDEFQDLNNVQLFLLKILSLPENNLYVVGDDDQMIYGFRGAEVRYLLDFQKHYPVSRSFVLSTNYRSSQKVVRHSRWLIDNNQQRVPKNIRAHSSSELGDFQVELAQNLWEQSKFGAEWIQKIKQTENLRWKDFAVLSRNNAFLITMAMALQQLKIPHSPISGAHLFKTNVGRQIHAYLTVILEPSTANSEHFEIVLKNPNKYLRNEFIATIQTWDQLVRASKSSELEGWVSDVLKEFVTRISLLTRLARSGGTKSIELLQAMDTELALMQSYKDRVRLTRELDEATDEIIFEVIQNVSTQYPQLSTFHRFVNQQIADESDRQDEDRALKDEVTLSTIHKAKGKEFQNVVYFNLSELSRHTSDQEDERRISYVGATRARQKLLITCLKSKPARFVREISLSPQLSSQTVDMLQTDIQLKKQQLIKHKQEGKLLLAQRNNFLEKLSNLTTKLSGNGKQPNRIARWLYESSIKKEQDKIDAITSQLNKLKNTRIKPLESELELMRSEINFRELLSDDKNKPS